MNRIIAVGVLSLAALGASAGTAISVKDAIIVSGGKIQYGQFRPGAAGDGGLSNVLSRAVGRPLRVYKEGEEPKDAKAVIYVGVTQAALDAGVKTNDLTYSSAHFKAVPGKVFLVGTHEHGVRNACRDFLQRYADFYYVAIEGDDPVRLDPGLAVPVGSRDIVPAINYRWLEHCRFDNRWFPTTKPLFERWQMNNGLYTIWGLEPWHSLSWECGGGCHTSFLYLDPKKYAKDHPEYFGMDFSGKRFVNPHQDNPCRSVGQLCYSNPEVKEIVYTELTNKLAQTYAKGMWLYDFTQQDNTSYLCQCPACKKKIAKYTRSADPNEKNANWNGGDAGLLLEFVNDLARRIRPQYPNAVIRTFAYVSTETPPKPGTIVPEPNVMMWVTDLYGSGRQQSNHNYPLDSARNRFRADRIREWGRLATRIEVWDYMLVASSAPEPHLDAIWADGRFFAANKVDRVFMEDHYVHQPYFELDAFAMSQCYFGTEKTADELLEIFCDRFYGKGAEKMREATDVLRKSIRDSANVKDDAKGGYLDKVDWDFYPESVLRTYVKLATEAWDLEAEGRVRSRIACALAQAYRALGERYSHYRGKTRECLELQLKSCEFALDEANYRIDEPKHREENVSRVKGRLADLRRRLADPHLGISLFKDMPFEVRDEEIGDIACIGAYSGDAEGGADKLDDPELDADQWNRKVPVWNPGASQGDVPKKGLGCGFFDRKDRSCWTKCRVKVVEPNDEKYHWYHLGEAKLDQDAIFYASEADWTVSYYLKSLYLAPADGKCNNWFDTWAYIKFQGPDYVPGSKKPNGIYFGRLVLKRLPPRAL